MIIQNGTTWAIENEFELNLATHTFDACIILYYILINITCFCIMLRSNETEYVALHAAAEELRMPECHLMLLGGVMGGFIGGMLATCCTRRKVHPCSFTVDLLVLIVIHCVMACIPVGLLFCFRKDIIHGMVKLMHIASFSFSEPLNKLCLKNTTKLATNQ